MFKPAFLPVLLMQDWIRGLSEIPASEFTQGNAQHIFFSTQLIPHHWNRTLSSLRSGTHGVLLSRRMSLNVWHSAETSANQA
jgi:hypothetical protein